jgi:hypothetical protein
MTDPTENGEQASKKEAKKKKKDRGPRRQERRFIAQSSYNPWLVRILGALGGFGLGAGVWAYFYGESFKKAAETARSVAEAAKEVGMAGANGGPSAEALRMAAIPAYLIAGAAILTGIAIWLGTSSETPLRVGDPGIAMEKGELRRMPWWGVSQITWESGNLALVVSGKDESGSSWTFKVPIKSHPEAAGFIIKEALDRVPKVIDIRDDVLEQLPGANPHAGTKVDLEPLQVVGKKDAITGKTISYEPDARVCTRCERVYFKRSVPKKCKCGASLVHLRSQLTAEDLEDEDEDEDEDELDDAAPSERS